MHFVIIIIIIILFSYKSTEGIFFLRSPPLRKFQLSLKHFFKCLDTAPFCSQKIPIPSVGEYGYFLELYILHGERVFN